MFVDEDLIVLVVLVLNAAPVILGVELHRCEDLRRLGPLATEPTEYVDDGGYGTVLIRILVETFVAIPVADSLNENRNRSENVILK